MLWGNSFVRRRPVLWLTLSVLIAGLLMAQLSYGHGNATGVVKQRMDLMSGIGKKMKSIAAMAKGQAPFDAEKIALQAAAIRQASPEIKPLFPAGSLDMPTEALPVIWEEWAHFSALTEQLADKAANLQAAAERGDRRDLMRQFAAVGKVCSGCHTDYRKKKE
jgi:cytochrome c556